MGPSLLRSAMCGLVVLLMAAPCAARGHPDPSQEHPQLSASGFDVKAVNCATSGGALTASVDCSNPSSFITLVISVVPGVAIPQLGSFTATLIVTSDNGPIPDWWNFQDCNAGSLNPHDPPTGCVRVRNAMGNASGALTPLMGDPAKERIAIVNAGVQAISMTASGEYSLVAFDISDASGGTCAGCSASHVHVSVEEVDLYDPMGGTITTITQANRENRVDLHSTSTRLITASAGPNGSITPSGVVVVNAGGDQSFTITPNPCHGIADVLVDGASVGPVSNYTFTNVSVDHTISASFAIDSYILTAAAGPGGSIAPAGSVVVNCGAAQGFTITPDACHAVMDVLVDGVSFGAVSSYTFTNVTANHTIAASFVLDVFQLTATAGPGGSITPAGSVVVNCGADQAFTITPDGCHQVTDVTVDGVSQGAVTSYTFTNVTADHSIAATFAPPTHLAAVHPARGGNAGSVSLQVVGDGLLACSTVKLARSAHSDILPQDTSLAPDGTTLTGIFDLTGADPGAWDVMVTNPGPQTVTLPGAFTIEGLVAPQLRVSVLGPSQVRVNRLTAFDVVLENPGNVDVLTVPLWLTGIPTGATVQLDFPLAAAPSDPGEPDWSQVPLTETAGGSQYVALVIPRVPPGTMTRRVRIASPGSFTLTASLTPPWVDGNVFRACLLDGGVVPHDACMGSHLSVLDAYLSGTAGLQAVSGVGVWAKIAWECEGASTLGDAETKAAQILGYLEGPVIGAGAAASCGDALRPTWAVVQPVMAVSSVDPNAKYGLSGGLGNTSEVTLTYAIRFENLQSATADAQQVIVQDPLDGATLDWTRVLASVITFGVDPARGLPYTVLPTPGVYPYQTTVDLRPSRNLLVRVSVNLDRATGRLTWSFDSIDPATGKPPPLIGFLPPNTTPPQGEGGVAFTVSPKAGLGVGTTISNEATIYFDGVPLETAPWSITVTDTAPPQSHMLPLPAGQDSATFTVRWQALNSPPDLKDFTIYAAEDGGSYRAWRRNTVSVADTFASRRGHAYGFYSQARDVYGNIEPAHPSPDAQTLAPTDVEGQAGPWKLALEGAQPNPARDMLHVSIMLASRAPATLELIDLAGRRMLRREVGSPGPGRHVVNMAPPRALKPGVYWLRLSQGARALGIRVAIIR